MKDAPETPVDVLVLMSWDAAAAFHRYRESIKQGTVPVDIPRWVRITFALLHGKDYGIEVSDKVPAGGCWLVEAL